MGTILFQNVFCFYIPSNSHNDGVVCISAWEKEMDVFVNEFYYKDHQALFERLGVKATEKGNYYTNWDIMSIGLKPKAKSPLLEESSLRKNTPLNTKKLSGKHTSQFNFVFKR